MMSQTTPIVFFVMDGASTREAIELSIRNSGFRVEFLPGPLDGEMLLGAIEHAVECAGGDGTEIACLRERYASLTPREREVMGLVASGLLNKQVGAELGTSVITVKAHRGKAMRKMQAGSFADLVRMAGKLGLPPDPGMLTGRRDQGAEEGRSVR